ncbi:MAG TPA: HNH endonuclease [Gammaproteobacteria bacterium]|nr:HNH endonuclease [Gammaproteobacteria bacterium]
MRTFVVRLNPDLRDCLPYSKYPTVKEYRSIHDTSPMDGFHEAVNFKSENGVIRGYLPPKHLTAMRDGEPFSLITITAKSANSGGNLIVGIQAGCKYVGETPRQGVNAIKSLGLVWHYTCPESLSLLVDEPVPSARELVLGENGKWVRGPTFKPTSASSKTILDQIEKHIEKHTNTTASRKKLKNIQAILGGMTIPTVVDLEAESSFEEEVKKALKQKLNKVKGNSSPSQREVRSFQYVRDPKVVAYVLKNSKGKCFDCGEKAPFISRSTGMPYLEVHHVTMLEDGGEDTISNAVALCPNCHRKRHFG